MITPVSMATSLNIQNLRTKSW